MSNHVCTPDTARRLVAAGFDLPTMLVWDWFHEPVTRDIVWKLVLREHGGEAAIPAPMATEIMEWHKGMSIYCNSDGFHSTMIRRWSHPNPAEAVAALVLAGKAALEALDE